MPNYHYKCCECKEVVEVTLPISTDPKAPLSCECGYTMSRIIVAGAQFPEKVGKVWAGDWFKKTYGRDMSEEATRRANKKMEYDAERIKLEQDGVKITHRSRQVDGDKRISIKDKKED